MYIDCCFQGNWTQGYKSLENKTLCFTNVSAKIDNSLSPELDDEVGQVVFRKNKTKINTRIFRTASHKLYFLCM